MKTGITEALALIFAMGAVIFSCRILPFLFFRKNGNEEDSLNQSKKIKTFLSFVEKTVPSAAMTVLAFNSITVPYKESLPEGITVLAASIFTALVYILKRNPLISIFGGTAAYILLERFLIV